MNFFSTLCLVHPPQKLSQLRGHYTEGNTLFARSGTKQLADFHYKIQFNQIYFQQRQVYFEIVSQLLRVTAPNQVSTVMVFTSNENYRFQLLKQIMLHLREDQKVFLLDYKLLKTGQIEDIDQIEDETKHLQQLTFQILDILHSQISHSRSMNSVKISLKIVGEEEFVFNILQVNLTNSKETEVIHKQFKLMFEEGVIDEEELGPRSKEMNESNNILLLTYLTFEEKKRIEEECCMEFLSRIKYSSEVQKLKENKKTQNLITQLTLLRENKTKLLQEIVFYDQIKKELDGLIGEELRIIRKHNIKFSEVGEYKQKLQKGMRDRIKQIESMKERLRRAESLYSKQSEASNGSTLLASMKHKLQNKLQSLTSLVSEANPGTYPSSLLNLPIDSKNDENQSVFSKSTYTRPKSAIRTRYLDLSKNIVMRQNSKVKSLVQELERQQQSLIESKKQEINTLPELSDLYGLMKQMSEGARNKFLMKHGL